MLQLTRKPTEQVFIGPVGAPQFRVKLLSAAYGRALLSVNGNDVEIDTFTPAQISDSVWIALRATHGRQAALCIAAPKDIPVHREEIAERILLEQVGIDSRRRDAAYSRQVARAL